MKLLPRMTRMNTNYSKPLRNSCHSWLFSDKLTHPESYLYVARSAWAINHRSSFTCRLESTLKTDKRTVYCHMVGADRRLHLWLTIIILGLATAITRMALCFGQRPLPGSLFCRFGGGVWQRRFFAGLSNCAGAAPALLALWSFLLLHETPRTTGVVGLGILLLGLLVVGSSAWWTRKEHATPGATSIVLALLVAFCISAYSVSDGAAVKFTDPAGYTVLETALTALFITPLTFKRYRWAALINEWQAQWPIITLIGVLTIFTYILVLIAYSLAPVSYAGAIREVSVVFAALIGWFWLGEKLGPFRAIGTAVIFVGILVIAVAG